MKKENDLNGEDNPSLQTYDCGGAIHIKFSIKREAINVVYKHNPIHGSSTTDQRYVAYTNLYPRQLRHQQLHVLC
jgi:hypothetical protein